MAMLNSPIVAAVTKTRLLALASLALTWWLASLLPQHRPMIPAEVSSRIQEARRRIPSPRFDWRASDDVRGHCTTSKLALLIEPRPIPHLVPLILHMVSVVPPDWRFLFIGSQWSVYSVGRAPAIMHQQATGKMTVMKLPEPWSVETKEDVSRLLTDVRFYDEFLPGVEWILKYEHDSILCANSPQSLDDWLDWSWAGAPRSEHDGFSGTDGLSLRRVSALRRVLKSQKRQNNSEPEDEWFGKRLSVMPNEKMTSKFQAAMVVQDALVEKPMGYYMQGGATKLDPQVWKNAEMRRKTFEYCPELSMIMDMKLERERCPDDDKQGGRHSDGHDSSKVAVEVKTLHAETGEPKPILPPQPPRQPQQHLRA